ncbi:MAG: Uncharacterised protein [Owenweeksia sp. TMED14]|nr:MAG: Uncharacterised protein [Owenweeksia sp. TMED14]
MGIVKRQSMWNLISGYLGVFFGAINGLFLFPWAFPNSPEEMGLVRWVISASLILGAFSHLGWPQAVVTFFPRINSALHSKILNQGLLASGICLFIFLLISMFTRDSLISFFLKGSSNSSFWFVFPFAATYIIFELYSSQLIHNQKVILSYWLKDTGRKLLLTLLLIGFGLGIISNLNTFLYLLLLGYAFYALIVFIAVKNIKITVKDFSTTWPQNEMIRYSLVMVLTAGAQMSFGQLDILMVGSFLGLAAVAQYSIAFSFGIVVAMPMKAMNASLRPIISKYVADENWSELRTLGMRSLSNQWVVSSFLFFIVLSVSPWIFEILPEVYQGGQSALIWVAAAQLVNVSTGPSGLVLVASKKFRWELYANLTLILFALIVGSIYIPSLGVEGAAKTFFSAVVIYNLVKLIALYKLTGDLWLGTKFLKALVWLVLGVIAHFLFWNLIFLLKSKHMVLILEPSFQQLFYLIVSFVEILIFFVWTLLGLYILNLASDLRSSLNQILNNNKK